LVSIVLLSRVDLDEARGLPDRQRMQKDGVDNREDRRVGADAQRQRDHRYQGEAGALPQHPHSALDIL